MIIEWDQPAPDMDPQQHFTGHTHWRVTETFGRGYYATLVQEHEVLHTHPIGFNTYREAERAVARLNARDERRETS